MKANSRLLLVALGVIALTACKKEITLDLPNESNKVVIEAIITEGPGPHQVRITRSEGLSASNDFHGIANATVMLSDDQGNSRQLVGAGSGDYTTTDLIGEPGRTYRLNALVDGTEYRSEVRMPAAVPLIALRIDSFPAFGSYSRFIVPVFADPAGVANYYRFIVRVNGEKLDGIYIESDRFTDGNLVMQPLFVSDLELKSGDTVEVTMQCITADVHHYFFTMAQNVSNASTPADPESNISGGSLGYFSAHTASTMSAHVP